VQEGSKVTEREGEKSMDVDCIAACVYIDALLFVYSLCLCSFSAYIPVEDAAHVDL
jgi:hypothetical protein